MAFFTDAHIAGVSNKSSPKSEFITSLSSKKQLMNLETTLFSCYVSGKFCIAHLKITFLIPLKQLISKGYFSNLIKIS